MTTPSKPRKTRSRHGLHALKGRVMVRGLHAVDMRTVGAQSLVAWRKELLRDLGEDLPAQEVGSS